MLLQLLVSILLTLSLLSRQPRFVIISSMHTLYLCLRLNDVPSDCRLVRRGTHIHSPVICIKVTAECWVNVCRHCSFDSTHRHYRRLLVKFLQSSTNREVLVSSGCRNLQLLKLLQVTLLLTKLHAISRGQLALVFLLELVDVCRLNTLGCWQ